MKKIKVIKEMQVLFDPYYNNLYRSNFIGLYTVMVNEKDFFKNILSQSKNSRRLCFMAKIIETRYKN